MTPKSPLRTLGRYSSCLNEGYMILDIKEVLSKTSHIYLPYPNYGFRFSNSFFPYISKIWNNLPKSIKLLSSDNFKTELKIFLKPFRIRHYNVGQKYSNSFLTRTSLITMRSQPDYFEVLWFLLVVAVAIGLSCG